MWMTLKFLFINKNKLINSNMSERMNTGGGTKN